MIPTPKEKAKAKELVDKYMVLGAAIFVAKQCAIICVDEILNIQGNYLIERTFWQQVKEEIQKL